MSRVMSGVNKGVSVINEQPRDQTVQRPIWTLTEAAQRTGVSRSTLRRRLSKGDLPNAVKDGKNGWMVPVEDLIAAGLTVSRPVDTTPFTPPLIERAHVTGEPAHPLLTEVEDLRRELAVERAHRQAAEQLADERERHLGTALRALRMLETAPMRPPTEQPTPAVVDLRDHPPTPQPQTVPTPVEAEQPHRRWWPWPRR